MTCLKYFQSSENIPNILKCKSVAKVKRVVI